MSWGVSAVGKAPAVAAAIAEQFAESKCAEPEERIRLAAQKVIAVAIAAQDPEEKVRVCANGSQSCSDLNAPEMERKYRNSLNITVTPED